MKIRKPKLKIEDLQKFFESEAFFEKKSSLVRMHAEAVLWYLNHGQLRVYEPSEEKLNVWVKKAILAFFPRSKTFAMNAGIFQYEDKLPTKWRTSLKGVRVVPGAIVRYGSFCESGVILMPSFINVGAYVGENTMVDTWATVGSCAQIGENVHLSGGVGIGGVLEPAQANPVIIENDVFVGSRAIVVEGVRVKKGAVLGAGVILTSSTKIFDLSQGGKQLASGEVPENAVIVSGTYNKEGFGLPCAMILGKRKSSTDLKTSLNAALRDFQVSV